MVRTKKEAPASLPRLNDYQLSSDSVEHEYGRDYSEETLQILRGIEKPLNQLDESSLDPIEDLSDYIDHELKLPPRVYDLLQKAGDEVDKSVKEAKEFKPDPALTQEVRYRQRLAQGTSQEDMTWLKLRAYHRAADQLRAEREQEKHERQRMRMEEHEVPVDRVPAELLDIHMTPAQLEERRKQAAMARSRQVSQAAVNMSAQESSSDDGFDPNSVTAGVGNAHADDPKLRAEFLSAVHSALAGMGLLQPANAPIASTSDSTSGGGVSRDGASEESSDDYFTLAPRATRSTPQTIYTEAYLRERELRTRLRQQQQQRALAFWASLVTVSGD